MIATQVSACLNVHLAWRLGGVRTPSKISRILRPFKLVHTLLIWNTLLFHICTRSHAKTTASSIIIVITLRSHLNREHDGRCYGAGQRTERVALGFEW